MLQLHKALVGNRRGAGSQGISILVRSFQLSCFSYKQREEDVEPFWTTSRLMRKRVWDARS